MIDHARGKIVIGEKEESIAKFDVWFRGPTGLIPTLKTAVDMWQTFRKLHQDDLEFYMMFKTVPIAIGESGLYEEMT